IHLSMLRTADAHGFRFDAVQMPIIVMDPHYRSFERQVLPVLLDKGIGVLGMKSLGDGDILSSGVVSAPECLRYPLSTPVSVVITGIHSIAALDQARDVALHFQPMSEAEKAAHLAKTAPFARAGEFERFKSTDVFDSTAHHPSWLDSAQI